MIVRPAASEHLEEILAILNREISDGFAHFGTEPLTLGELESQFLDEPDRHVWVVALEADEVAGFARSHSWKPRGAYRFTAEVGAYVRPEFQRRGFGRLLYEALLPALETRGFHTLLGGIALPNPASVRLHESFGFTHVGTLPDVGWKHGEWRSVGYWSKTFSVS